jgi:enoyl-CoA hydratase/carnithine racemase
MTTNAITTQLEDGILTVTLNRPDKLNAMTEAMIEALIATLDEADRNDAVRAVIFTGAGRAFCAGADLSGGANTFGRAKPDNIDEHRDAGGVLVLRIFELRKPVIAAINGPATGVGITMTLPCDVRIAATSAKMGFVFSRRGIAPDGCSSWFAPRIVGISQAAQWFMSGRVFGADEALQSGLVSELVAPEQLLARAREIAKDLTAQSSPVSVAMVRRLLWRNLGAAHPSEALRLESKALWVMGKGPDSKEGVSSFLEKREPRFSMRVSTDFPDFL